ncbi:MAG: ABC transporter ATP-binding protein [Chloroflexota bacterium]
MRNLRHVFPYLRRHRLRIIIGFLAVAGGTGLSVLQPHLFGLGIDTLRAKHPSLGHLTFLVGLFLAAAVGQSLLAFVQRSTINRVSRYVEYDLRNDAFRHLQALDQRFYQENYTGDLMARLTNDLNQVRQFVGMGMISLISTGMMLVVVAVVMVFTDWKLALVAFAVLPFVSITMVVVGRTMQRRFRLVQDQFGRVSTHAQENFSGIRVVKAFVQEDREIEAFARTNQDFVRYNLSYVRLSGIMWPLMFFVVGIALALVLYVGGTEVASGEITLGTWVEFNLYLGLLTWPMISLGWVINMYQQGAASMARVMEVMNRNPDIRDSGRTLPIRHIDGAIEFRNVGVRYDDQQVLHDISFTVPAGKTAAIVGVTGVGKSTLMSLIPRVMEADEGEVLVDGVDVRRIPLDVLRRNVGYVPQETFLFSASLRSNTMFGIDEAPDSEVLAALEVSRLSQDLEQFPHGLDTIVGERGVSLSGGQKQRTALARAVMRDPTILILDDSLSSIDTHTQAEILTRLKDVMRDRTTVITSMRISAIKDADVIIVLGDGGVAEHGTHRELLLNDGLYARMYRRELLQQELEVE